MDDESHTLLILLGLYLFSKYTFEIVPAIENAGARVYDALHDDAGHKRRSAGA